MKGEMWHLCRLVAQVINQVKWYDSMGIETTWSAFETCCNDARVVASNDFAQLLVDLACATILGEATRLLPMIFGYPIRFTLLLDESTRPQLLADLMSDKGIAGAYLLLYAPAQCPSVQMHVRTLAHHARSRMFNFLFHNSCTCQVVCLLVCLFACLFVCAFGCLPALTFSKVHLVLLGLQSNIVSLAHPSSHCFLGAFRPP